jgi:hypothetical protein
VAKILVMHSINTEFGCGNLLENAQLEDQGGDVVIL